MKNSFTDEQIISMLNILNSVKSHCEEKDKQDLERLSNMIKENLSLSGKKYTIAPPDKLREVCINNQLFTCANNRRYETFFKMNESGTDFNIMVLYAYACSDIPSIDIVKDILREAQNEYVQLSGYVNKNINADKCDDDMVKIDTVIPIHRFGTKYKQVSYWENHNVRKTTIIPMNMNIQRGDFVNKQELFREAENLFDKITAVKRAYEETRESDSCINADDEIDEER